MRSLTSFTKALYHGRAASWTDVCIDTAGVFAGILIILAIVSIYIALRGDNKNKKKELKEE